MSELMGLHMRSARTNVHSRRGHMKTQEALNVLLVVGASP